MPYDSNGIWSLTPGYLAVTGNPVIPTNHNPPLEDISANGLSAVMVRDGRAPATGNWSMGSFKIANLANGTAAADAVNKSQLDSAGLVGPQAQGFLYGLTLSNNAGDTVNDIDIAVGSAAASGSPYNVMTLASALGKRLDAAWAVGGTPGATVGGLDTGAIANTTYYVYLIQRSDTGVVDACFSASASSPTIGGAIPAAYDRYRRIGPVVRVSAALRLFTQRGDSFTWTTPILDVSATSAGTAAVTRTLSVPIGVPVEAILNVLLSNAGGGNNVYLSALTEADLAPSGSLAPLGTLGGASASALGQARVWTNASGQIRSRQLSGGAGDTLYIATLGFIDTRGRT